MRIITPRNAAFSPSGPDNQANIVASDTIIQTITADVAVPAFEIGPLPESGIYLLTLYLLVDPTTAATGVLAANLTVNAGTGDATVAVSISQALNAVIWVNDTQFVGVRSTSITLDWDVSLFSTGSADIKLIAAATKLF